MSCVYLLKRCRLQPTLDILEYLLITLNMHDGEKRDVQVLFLYQKCYNILGHELKRYIFARYNEIVVRPRLHPRFVLYIL